MADELNPDTIRQLNEEFARLTSLTKTTATDFTTINAKVTATGRVTDTFNNSVEKLNTSFGSLNAATIGLTDSFKNLSKQIGATDFSSLSQKIGDAATQSLTTMAGRLGSTSAEQPSSLSNRTIRMVEDQAQKLDQEGQFAGKAVKIFTNNATAAGAATTQISQQQQDLGQNIQNSGNIFSRALGATGKMIGSVFEKIVSTIKTFVTQVLPDMAAGFAEAVKGLAGALLDGKKGLRDFGTAAQRVGGGLGGMVYSLGKLGGIFGPLAKTAGVLIEVIGKLIGAVFRQADQINKTYETLSEFGSLDSSGIRSVLDDVHKFGLTLNEVSVFEDVIRSTSESLIAFGGTAGDGRRALADMFKTNALAETEREFKRLGYTTESYIKTWARSTALQTKTGESLGKTQEQVNRSSNQYLRTLSELSELTGISRDKLQEQREQALRDEAFLQKDRELQRAATTEEGRAAYQRFKQLTAISGEFGGDIAEVIKEVTTAGTTITERTAQINAFTNGAIERATQQFNRGEIDQQQMRQQIAQAVLKNADRFGSQLISILGPMSKELGINSEAIQRANQVQGQTTDAAQTAAKTINTLGKDAGSLREAQIKAEEISRKLTQTLEKTVNTLSGPVTEGFMKLVEYIELFNQGIVKFLRKIGLYVGDISADQAKTNVAATEQKLAQSPKQLEQDKQKLLARYGFKTEQDVEREGDTERSRRYKQQLAQIEQTDKARQNTLQQERRAALEEETAALRREGRFKEQADQLAALTQSKQKVIDIEKRLTDAQGIRADTLKELNLTEEQLQKADGKTQQEFIKRLEASSKALKNQLTQNLEDYNKKLEQYNASSRANAAGSQTVVSRAAPQPGAAAVTGIDQAKYHGLKIKSEESAAGGEISDRTLAAAKWIQENIADFKVFTSLNDGFHKGMNSKHTKGLALDFTLNNDPNVDPAKRGQEIKDMLERNFADLGIKVLNEYDPKQRSANATGGHIHVEFARALKGGIARATPGGVPVLAAEGGKNEAFMPFSPGGTVPVEIRAGKLPGLEQLGDTIKGMIQSFEERLTAAKTETPITPQAAVRERDTSVDDLHAMMKEKLEQIVGVLTESNSIQSDILLYNQG